MTEEQARGQSDAYRSPHVDALRLVAVLNSFFNSHPASSPVETTPYCCAKTLLAQLISSLGSEEIFKIFKTLKISNSSFISRSVTTSSLSLTPHGL
jgi:hypothetical protein